MLVASGKCSGFRRLYEFDNFLTERSINVRSIPFCKYSQSDAFTATLLTSAV